MPPGLGEARIGPLQVFYQWQSIHHDELRHCSCVVECRAVGDRSSAIVTHDGKPLVPHLSQQGDDNRGHSALRRLLVLGLVGAEDGTPVAWEVRADDGVAMSKQRGDPVPGRVRSRVSVQEHDRAPMAAVTQPHRQAVDIDRCQGEVIEHLGRLPGIDPTHPL